MNKIINVKPKEYLEQGIRYCGGYTMKAILSAYNLDDNMHPKDYIPLLGKIIGTFPRMIQQTLKEYGLNCSIKTAASLSDIKKLEAIKNELNKNRPVILFIGNGYTKRGKYYWLGQKLISHWISVWGYNDDKKVFYLYDSYYSKKDKLPIGNVKRTYSQVLRDWRGTFYTKSYLYISLDKK